MNWYVTLCRVDGNVITNLLYSVELCKINDLYSIIWCPPEENEFPSESLKVPLSCFSLAEFNH